MNIFYNILYLLAIAYSTPDTYMADKIVAVIDHDIITWRELYGKAQPMLENANTPTNDILKNVLNQEIDERLMLREIAKNKDKISATEKDIDKAVQEVLRMNGLNHDQLQSALYAQGISLDDYRNKLRDQIERSRLIQLKMQAKIQIDDSAVEKRCQERQRMLMQDKQICLSHILFAIPEHANQATRQTAMKRAQHVRKKLSADGNFTTYALQYSDDTYAKDGVLGCFSKGEMLEEIEQAVAHLQEGDVSRVIETSLGLHIIKFDHTRVQSTDLCNNTALLDNLRNELYQEDMQQHMTAWLDEMRQKAFIEIRL